MISDEASGEAAVIGTSTSLTANTANSSNSSSGVTRPLMPTRRFMRYSAASAANSKNRLSNIPVKRYTDKSFEIQTGISSIGRSRRLSECIMGQELATPRVHDFHVDECLAPKKDHVSVRVGSLASPADLASRFDDTLNRMTPVSEARRPVEDSNQGRAPHETTTLTAAADGLLSQLTLPPTRRHFSRYSATAHPSAAVRKTSEAVARTARRRSIGISQSDEGCEVASPSAINQDVIDGVELVSEPATSPLQSEEEGELAASLVGTPAPPTASNKMKSPPTFKRRRSARLSGSGKRSRLSEDQAA